MLNSILFRIRRLFRKKSDKRAFAFYDGSKWRTVDPIEILHGLDSHPKYLASEHSRQVRAGDREAIEITAQAVCDVFGVQPFLDGTGLTIGERVALLDAFNGYVEWVKKNTEHGATPAPSTV